MAPGWELSAMVAPVRAARVARLVATGAVAVALAGCHGAAPAASAPASSSTVAATAVAASAPAPTEPVRPLAQALRYHWVHDPTPVPGVVLAPNAANLDIGAQAVGFYAHVTAGQNPTTILNSSAGVLANGMVRLTLQRDEAGCHASDVGSYDLTRRQVVSRSS